MVFGGSGAGLLLVMVIIYLLFLPAIIFYPMKELIKSISFFNSLNKFFLYLIAYICCIATIFLAMYILSCINL